MVNDVSDTPKILQVRNWSKHQSWRSDRGQPPWIKIYRALLRDVDWISLSDAQRGQLVSIWMLAADRNGEVPNDPKIIRKLCQLDDEPDLEALQNAGFLLDASLTPTWRHDDANVTTQSRVEEKREEQNRTEEISPDPSPGRVETEVKVDW